MSSSDLDIGGASDKNKSGSDKSGSDKAGSDRSGSNKDGSDRSSNEKNSSGYSDSDGPATTTANATDANVSENTVGDAGAAEDDGGAYSGEVKTLAPDDLEHEASGETLGTTTADPSTAALDDDGGYSLEEFAMPEEAHEATFNLYDVVEATWKRGTTRYPGTIVNANGDGTYSIQYDDGDYDASVPASEITLKDTLDEWDVPAVVEAPAIPAPPAPPGGAPPAVSFQESQALGGWSSRNFYVHEEMRWITNMIQVIDGKLEGPKPKRVAAKKKKSKKKKKKKKNSSSDYDGSSNSDSDSDSYSDSDSDSDSYSDSSVIEVVVAEEVDPNAEFPVRDFNAFIRYWMTFPSLKYDDVEDKEPDARDPFAHLTHISSPKHSKKRLPAERDFTKVPLKSQYIELIKQLDAHRKRFRAYGLNRGVSSNVDAWYEYTKWETYTKEDVLVNMFDQVHDQYQMVRDCLRDYLKTPGHKVVTHVVEETPWASGDPISVLELNAVASAIGPPYSNRVAIERVEVSDVLMTLHFSVTGDETTVPNARDWRVGLLEPTLIEYTMDSPQSKMGHFSLPVNLLTDGGAYTLTVGTNYSSVHLFTYDALWSDPKNAFKKDDCVSVLVYYARQRGLVEGLNADGSYMVKLDSGEALSSVSKSDLTKAEPDVFAPPPNSPYLAPGLFARCESMKRNHNMAPVPEGETRPEFSLDKVFVEMFRFSCQKYIATFMPENHVVDTLLKYFRMRLALFVKDGHARAHNTGLANILEEEDAKMAAQREQMINGSRMRTGEWSREVEVGKLRVASYSEDSLLEFGEDTSLMDSTSDSGAKKQESGSDSGSSGESEPPSDAEVEEEQPEEDDDTQIDLDGLDDLGVGPKPKKKSGWLCFGGGDGVDDEDSDTSDDAQLTAEMEARLNDVVTWLPHVRWEQADDLDSFSYIKTLVDNAISKNEQSMRTAADDIQRNIVQKWKENFTKPPKPAPAAGAPALKTTGSNSNNSDSDSDSDSDSESEEAKDVLAMYLVDFQDQEKGPLQFFKRRLDHLARARDELDQLYLAASLIAELRQIKIYKMRRTMANNYVKYYEAEKRSEDLAGNEERQAAVTSMRRAAQLSESEIISRESRYQTTVLKRIEADLPPREERMLGCDLASLEAYKDGIVFMLNELTVEYNYLADNVLDQARTDRFRLSDMAERLEIKAEFKTSVDLRKRLEEVKKRLAEETTKEANATARIDSKEAQILRILDEAEMLLLLEQMKARSEPEIMGVSRHPDIAREEIQNYIKEVIGVGRVIRKQKDALLQKQGRTFESQLTTLHSNFKEFIMYTHKKQDELRTKKMTMKELLTKTRQAEQRQLMLISKFQHMRRKSKSLVEKIAEIDLARNSQAINHLRRRMEQIELLMRNLRMGYSPTPMSQELEAKIEELKTTIENLEEKLEVATKSEDKDEIEEDIEKRNDEIEFLKAVVEDINDAVDNGLPLKKAKYQARLTKLEEEKQKIRTTQEGEVRVSAVESYVETRTHDAENEAWWSEFWRMKYQHWTTDFKKKDISSLEYEFDIFNKAVRGLLDEDVRVPYEEALKAKNAGRCFGLCGGEKVKVQDDDKNETKTPFQKFMAFNPHRILLFLLLVAGTFAGFYGGYYRFAPSVTKPIPGMGEIYVDVSSCVLEFVPCTDKLPRKWLYFNAPHPSCDQAYLYDYTEGLEVEVSDDYVRLHNPLDTGPDVELLHRVMAQSRCKAIITLPDLPMDRSLVVNASGLAVDVMGVVALGEGNFTVVSDDGQTPVYLSLEYLQANEVYVDLQDGLVQIAELDASTVDVTTENGDVSLVSTRSSLVFVSKPESAPACFAQGAAMRSSDPIFFPSTEGLNMTFGDNITGAPGSGNTTSTASSTGGGGNSTGGNSTDTDTLVSGAVLLLTDKNSSADTIVRISVTGPAIVNVNVRGEDGQVYDAGRTGNWSSMALFSEREHEIISAAINPELEEGQFDETFMVMTLRGANTPEGIWFYASSRRYVALTPDIVTILSGGMLRPSVTFTQLTQRSERWCGWNGEAFIGPSGENEQDTHGPKWSTDVRLADVYEEVRDGFDEIREDPQFFFTSDVSCITVFMDDPANPGEVIVECLDMWKEGPITIVLAMTLIVAVLLAGSTLYFCVAMVYKVRMERYRHGLVSNHRFYIRKNEERIMVQNESDKLTLWISQHTTPFFIIELLFPNPEPVDQKIDSVIEAETTHNKVFEMLVVLAHYLGVVVPIAPLFVGVFWYHKEARELLLLDEYRRVGMTVLFFLMVAYILFASIHALFYYATVRRSKFQVQISEEDRVEDEKRRRRQARKKRRRKQKGFCGTYLPCCTCCARKPLQKDGWDDGLDDDGDDFHTDSVLTSGVSGIRKVYNLTYAFVVITMLFLSLLFVYSLFLWVILGIFVNPTSAIPIAAAVGGTLAHVISLKSRLEKHYNRLMRKLEDKTREVLNNMSIGSALGDLKNLAEGAALSAFASKRFYDVGLSPVKFEKAMKDGFVPVFFGYKLRDKGVPMEAVVCTVTGGIDVWIAIRGLHGENLPGLENELKNANIDVNDVRGACRSGYVSPMLRARLHRLNINPAVVNGVMLDVLKRKKSIRSAIFTEKVQELLEMTEDEVNSLSSLLREGYLPAKERELLHQRGVPTRKLDRTLFLRIQIDDFFPPRIVERLEHVGIDIPRLKYMMRNDIVSTDIKKKLSKAGYTVQALRDEVQNTMPEKLKEQLTLKCIPPLLLNQYLSMGFVPFEHHIKLRNSPSLKLETDYLSVGTLRNIRAGYGVPGEIERTLLKECSSHMMLEGKPNVAAKLQSYLMGGLVPVPVSKSLASIGVFVGAMFENDPFRQLVYPGWGRFGKIPGTQQIRTFYSTHHFERLLGNEIESVLGWINNQKAPANAQDIQNALSAYGVNLNTYLTTRVHGGWYGQLRDGYISLPVEAEPAGNRGVAALTSIPRSTMSECVRAGVFPDSVISQWEENARGPEIVDNGYYKEMYYGRRSKNYTSVTCYYHGQYYYELYSQGESIKAAKDKYQTFNKFFLNEFKKANLNSEDPSIKPKGEVMAQFAAPHVHFVTGDVLDREHPVGKRFIEYLRQWTPYRPEKLKRKAEPPKGQAATTGGAGQGEKVEEKEEKKPYVPTLDDYGFDLMCDRLTAEDIDMDLKELVNFLVGQVEVSVVVRNKDSKTETAQKKGSEGSEGSDEDEDSEKSSGSGSDKSDKSDKPDVEETKTTVITKSQTGKDLEYRMMVPYEVMQKLEQAGINTIRLQERMFRDLQFCGEDAFKRDKNFVSNFKVANIKLEEVIDMLSEGDVDDTMCRKLRLAGINPYVLTSESSAINQIRAQYFTANVLDKIKLARKDRNEVYLACRRLNAQGLNEPEVMSLDDWEMYEARNTLEELDKHISMRMLIGPLPSDSELFNPEQLPDVYKPEEENNATDGHKNREEQNATREVAEPIAEKDRNDRVMGVFRDPESMLAHNGFETGATVEEDRGDDKAQKVAVDQMVREIVDRVLTSFGISQRTLIGVLLVSTFLLLLILAFLFIGISVFSDASVESTVINSVMVLMSAGSVNASQRPEEDENAEEEYTAYIEEDIDELM